MVAETMGRYAMDTVIRVQDTDPFSITYLLTCRTVGYMVRVSKRDSQAVRLRHIAYALEGFRDYLIQRDVEAIRERNIYAIGQST